MEMNHHVDQWHEQTTILGNSTSGIRLSQSFGVDLFRNKSAFATMTQGTARVLKRQLHSRCQGIFHAQIRLYCPKTVNAFSGTAIAFGITLILERDRKQRKKEDKNV